MEVNVLALFAVASFTGLGIAEAVSFHIYSCPLSSSASFLSISSNKDCSSSGKRDIPYGIRHTYVQIGSQCYDWGNWNYPRHLNCNDADLACCVRTHRHEYSGHTSCENKVHAFETAWTNQHKSYHVYSWNCQVYSNAMKEYLLNDCNVNAPSAFGYSNAMTAYLVNNCNVIAASAFG